MLNYRQVDIQSMFKQMQKPNSIDSPNSKTPHNFKSFFYLEQHRVITEDISCHQIVSDKLLSILCYGLSLKI